MRTVLLIAADNVRALVHRRLLMALMLATLGLTVVFSMAAGGVQGTMESAMDHQAEAHPEGSGQSGPREIPGGAETMVSYYMGIFYWFTALGGTMVALFIFSTAISTDIRNGTIAMVLAKPVTRTQFLLGKCCGAAAVLAAYSVLIGVALVYFASANDLAMVGAVRVAPWLMLCSNLIVGSVALFLSLLMHPALAATIAFFASASFFSSPNPLYFVLPSYSPYNVATSFFTGSLISTTDIVMLTLYAFDLVAIFVLLALWRFRSKEVL